MCLLNSTNFARNYIDHLVIDSKYIDKCPFFLGLSDSSKF